MDNISIASHWQPSCSKDLILLRAELLHELRAFFYAHGVLEVETPILCQAAGTDPHLEHFTSTQSTDSHRLFLQTSPEFAMKRLLAAHTQSIYQICKAFRQGESGRYHNPEFTLLEWYRVGFDLQALMADVEALLHPFLPANCFPEKTVKVTYSTVFKDYTGLDALVFDADKYQSAAVNLGYPEAVALCGVDLATWLDFLFSHCVQPHLGVAGLCMVYDYPACLPSLARLKQGYPLIVERVEVFIQGIELGNGYFELADAAEQQYRFEQDLYAREQRGAVIPEIDRRLLAALESGLPDCSGIAIGLDRLLMVMSQQNSIDDVISFPIHHA